MHLQYSYSRHLFSLSPLLLAPSLHRPSCSLQRWPLWSPGIVLTFAWQNIKQQICPIWVVSCNVILSNWQFPKGFRKERTIPQTPGRSDTDCQSSPCFQWVLISEQCKNILFSQVYFLCLISSRPQTQSKWPESTIFSTLKLKGV